jgi:beta-N-acetylhexosaminidase
MLDGEQPAYIEADIGRADWIILSMAGAAGGQPQLVSRFLGERPELLQERNVILFSLGAPYYFDATDISRLTAYFALYSQQPQFLDVAARLLFQEIAPSGASPVSIPGIGYDLISVMMPDPSQVITLSLEPKPAPEPATESATPVATPVPLFSIGDAISVRTGTLRDLNGHPVPDGTVVRFSMTLGGEGTGIVQQLEAVTTDGVARAAFGLEKPGLLEIRASSEQASLSEVLQLDVSQTGAVAVTVVAPVLTPPPGEDLPVPVDRPLERGLISSAGYPGFDAWLLSMLFVAGSAWIADRLGNRGHRRRGGVLMAIGTVLGGLLAYDYVVMGLPGGVSWPSANGLPGLLGLVFLGELAGFFLAWLWLRRSPEVT